MEEKYYTPEIGDLRIGYEFERIIDDENGDDIWIKDVIKFEHGWLELPEDYNERIRVPCLTKEQIEVEGYSLTSLNHFLYIYFDDDTHILQIKDYNGDCYFNAECKSINEFRTICKWLKI